MDRFIINQKMWVNDQTSGWYDFLINQAASTFGPGGLGKIHPDPHSHDNFSLAVGTQEPWGHRLEVLHNLQFYEEDFIITPRFEVSQFRKLGAK